MSAAPASEVQEISDMQAAALQDLPVRVQVTPKDTATILRATAAARVIALNSLGWREIGFLPPENTLQVQAQSGGLKVSGINHNEVYQALRVESPNQQSALQTDQGWYRGHLTLSAAGGGFSVINEVPLEQYLYSVVPSEMPASWPLEALKSQAVAARTYALSHLGQYRKRGYDVTSTTSSQVYQGVKAEHANSTRAVNETAGLIVTYNQQPIQAYFHSTSGGRTENGADLWANLPYLQPVDDVDNASPKYTWHESQTQAQVRQRMRAHFKTDLGEILALQPLTYTQGGRIKTLRVLGKSGERVIKGEQVRTVLQLNSTFFNVGGIDSEGKLIKTPAADKVPVSFQFAGRGWGHGMGLSQWGARQLALDGYPYHSILGHYYRGTQIERINPNRYQLAMLR